VWRIRVPGSPKLVELSIIRRTALRQLTEIAHQMTSFARQGMHDQKIVTQEGSDERFRQSVLS
jgi:hypothetical protein